MHLRSENMVIDVLRLGFIDDTLAELPMAKTLEVAPGDKFEIFEEA